MKIDFRDLVLVVQAREYTKEPVVQINHFFQISIIHE